ncbi:MAG: Signal recognition particle receptor protein FtsY [Myxococcaceae bacterium]|nr:Signal recognition particle receptor protein FtsY [Myxococcaceae bacterium]
MNRCRVARRLAPCHTDGVDGSPTPPTPYRDGKALADIIPPDRRREKAIALVGVSMVAGVALWLTGLWVIETLTSGDAEPIQVVQTPGYVAGIVPRSTLSGPGGLVAMPPPKRSVVNVWLQGCSDCMPAFEAMAQLESEGGLNVAGPIINVAYGEADETWARRYGVGKNLVFDPGGGSVVKPLGIGTFTTLVVEPDGTIIHRDRPDRAGYVSRVRAAMAFGTASWVANNPDPPTVDESPDVAGELDSAAVQRVIAEHRAALKRACWDRADRENVPSHASVVVTLTVGTDGRVTQITSRGDDPIIAKCIEAQAKRWVFPRPSAATSVNIPFKFLQE